MSGRLNADFPVARLEKLSQSVWMVGPLIVPPGQGRLLDMGNFQAEVLASAEQTDREFTLLLTQHEAAGFGPPLHRHRDAAEAFFVLEGEYLMFIEDEQRSCPAGSFVYVPRGVPHTFKVTSAEPGRKLNLFAPAAMVGFFEELALAEASGAADADLLDQIAERNHMDVLGPVPDTYL